MHAAELADDVRFVIEMRVEAGLFLYGFHHCPDDERQQRQARTAFLLLIIETAAQFFQLRDIDLFDDGDMRNVAFRFRHAFGNLAAKADDLDLIDRGVGRVAG